MVPKIDRTMKTDTSKSTIGKININEKCKQNIMSADFNIMVYTSKILNQSNLKKITLCLMWLFKSISDNVAYVFEQCKFEIKINDAMGKFVNTIFNMVMYFF